ncbi:HAD family hydrolase [Metabacillus iocasae]|uniref:FMN phosphatase YigB (HAD superfamily) n=1 Tax=Priestia iocasae TaxID=2291674 RepID=A0ABS2QUL8_9BACI|nr:HAD family hydrolase [Metabacillus iocasae]MBM7702199.1 FMN phosphatase YigB (HAD superfamily) [Metabacillus iocasae]
MFQHDIHVIVFDLDGTLYEDTHHFDYYAIKLEQKIAPRYRTMYRQDYEHVLSGQHALRVGRIYDVKNDLILSIKNKKADRVHRWNGTRLSQQELKRLYPNTINVNLDDMLSIGDLWWVPSSIARHYGVSNEESYDAFLQTREYMMSDQFQMKRVEGLKELLETISLKCKLVLLTNSPERDSEAIIHKLGLDHVFHKKIFMGQKPTMTTQRFEEVKRHFQIDFENMLSVGDNLINEIAPAKELGCSTIYIDPFHIGNEASADVTVERITDAISILDEYFKKK